MFASQSGLSFTNATISEASMVVKRGSEEVSWECLEVDGRALSATSGAMRLPGLPHCPSRSRQTASTPSQPSSKCSLRPIEFIGVLFMRRLFVLLCLISGVHAGSTTLTHLRCSRVHHSSSRPRCATGSPSHRYAAGLPMFSDLHSQAFVAPYRLWTHPPCVILHPPSPPSLLLHLVCRSPCLPASILL